MFFSGLPGGLQVCRAPSPQTLALVSRVRGQRSVASQFGARWSHAKPRSREGKPHKVRRGLAAALTRLAGVVRFRSSGFPARAPVRCVFSGVPCGFPGCRAPSPQALAHVSRGRGQRSVASQFAAGWSHAKPRSREGKPHKVREATDCSPDSPGWRCAIP